MKKLREARQPFADAPPRPQGYQPVTPLDDESAAGLLARFRAEVEMLDGEVFVVAGDTAACEKVVELIREQSAETVLSWDFEHIPIEGLESGLAQAGIAVQQPNIQVDHREDMLGQMAEISIGVTGADAAAASTGTLVVSTGPGRSRIPTILPPTHIAVITQSQILPRIEDWVRVQREDDFAALLSSSNLCYISGPSRTADIEKNLVLGMHGPGRLQVIIKTD